jgi:putative heme transporter
MAKSFPKSKHLQSQQFFDVFCVYNSNTNLSMRQPSSQTPVFSAQRVASAMIIITILVYWLYILQDILIPLAISIIISMLLYPVVNWLEQRRFSRLWAVMTTIVLFTAVLVGLMVLASMQIANFSEMVPQLIEKLQIVFEKLQVWATDTFGVGPKRQISELKKYGQDALKNGGTLVTSALSATTNTLGNITLAPLYVFFLLYYRDLFRTFFYKVFHKTRRQTINSVLQQIYEAVKSYWAGVLTVTIIVGTLNSIGLLALGIDYAIFFGFFAAVLLIIPYIGILIGSILPIIVALATKDSPMYAVGVAGLFFFIQILEGNFITPHVVGSKISINPLAAILALLFGASLWGIAGMILSLPVVAILKVVFDAVPSLKPYGYLLGEPEQAKDIALKKRKIIALEEGLLETLGGKGVLGKKKK